MAYIQVHQSLLTHRKTLHLASLLSITPAQTIGHLICLWCWALDNAPSGSLAGITPPILALACQWQDDPQLLLNGLVDTGFLDADEDGALIHDWFDYAGRLIATREAAKRRTEQWREKRKELVTHNVRITNAQRTDNVRSQTRVEKSITTESTNVDSSADKSAQPVKKKESYVQNNAEMAALEVALIETFWKPANSAEWAKFRKAESQYLEAKAQPAEIAPRKANLQLHWPNITIDPLMLASRWAMAEHPPVRAGPNGSKPRGGRSTDLAEADVIEGYIRKIHAKDH